MTNNSTPTPITVSELFELAAIVRRHRPWHNREQYAFSLHPVVIAAVEHDRPVDWHQLVLEWPHQAVGDHSKLAYTRDEKKGIADVQTVTTAGKYLARHWPQLKADVLRKIVDAHITKMQGNCEFLPATVEAIVRSVQEGPTSCMKWDTDEVNRNGAHPYEVYTPELGWRAAVRRNSEGKIAGRALVHDGTHMRHNVSTGRSVFVRSFKAEDDDPHSSGYSYSDEKLEAWLLQQGVYKYSEWPLGTPIAHVEGDRHNPTLPYLDGDRQCVSRESGGRLYVIDSGDESGYCCEDTEGGYADSEDSEDDDDDYSYCEDCDDRTHHDDMRSVDRERRYVCSHCCNNNYTQIDGDYVPDDHVAKTRCGSVQWDDRGDTPDNVRYLDEGMHAGEYVTEDDAVCDIDGNYWHVDDVGDSIVQLCDDSTDSHEYVTKEDAVQVDDDWYHLDADINDDKIRLITVGEHEGTYVVYDDAVEDIAGQVWQVDDEWVAMAQAKITPLVLVNPGTYFVRLHDDSVCAEEACDAATAILVDGVGWFCQQDVDAGTLVRIQDDVYALAADLETV